MDYLGEERAKFGESWGENLLKKIVGMWAKFEGWGKFLLVSGDTFFG